MSLARPVCGNTALSSSRPAAVCASIQLAARARARRSPSTMRTAACCAVKLFLQQLTRDHKALNLARAFANGAELDVAIELFDRVVLDEAVAAVNLQRLVGHTHRNFRRKQFRHGGFARHSFA